MHVISFLFYAIDMVLMVCVERSPFVSHFVCSHDVLFCFIDIDNFSFAQ